MVNQPIGNHGLGVFWCGQISPWTPPSRSDMTLDLSFKEMRIAKSKSAYNSLIIGSRSLGW